MVNPTLPDVIAPYRLADRDAELSGVIEGKRLERLADAVDTLGDVRVHAAFGKNDEGFRCVEGTAELLVEAPCERCLEPMVLPLETGFSLVLVSEAVQLQSVPRHLEPWLVTPASDVPVEELVEDSILLALPPFPVHPADECEIQTEFTGPANTVTDDEAVVATPTDNEENRNPFSVLAQMKSRRTKQE